MAVAGNGPPGGAIFPHHLQGRRARARPRHRLARQSRARKLPAASEAPSTTEPQPRIPAATAPCSASGAAARVMRRPARSAPGRARRSPPAWHRACAAGRAWQCAGNQQPEVLGEGDRADQFRGQVTPADHDGVVVGRGDRRAAMVLTADFHFPPVCYFRIPNKMSICETYFVPTARGCQRARAGFSYFGYRNRLSADAPQNSTAPP